MADIPITKEIILNTAEEVLRKFGPNKANVQDIARALNVSHPTIYKHFESKLAIWDAVIERWLDRMFCELKGMDIYASSPDAILRQWFKIFITNKQNSAKQDPELFIVFSSLAANSREVLDKHIQHLITHLSQIIVIGVDANIFCTQSPEKTAWALFRATTRFHHPAHASEWLLPEINDNLESVLDLLFSGLLSPNTRSNVTE